ncbi:corticotropin-releasing factor receptor 2 isoform X2 [Bos mutus]|uniref:corticotropin-releasing factor receptor 2 isoform X2 n=1 Tax=Bos mutus TaxID=72004 RepID=UPI0038B68903
MDAALLHSLLETNCSLELAEELVLDGWGLPLHPDGPYSYCNTTLDRIGTCWPRSAAGALVERPCPEYFNGVKYNTTRNAYRECLENGTWASRINYSQCEPILDDKQRKYDLHYRIALIVNYLGHCVSVAALVGAFLLFLALRSIRCLRNVIHWNLITTFILRNVMWFLLQLIDHEVHESNEVWCRCITTIFNYFVVTNFFWMFVEGCYLHTAIVMTYSTERLRKWLFLFIGWCVPCPIVIAWAIGKLYYENEQCWFGKEPGDLVDYIYQGPIILVLLIPWHQRKPQPGNCPLQLQVNGGWHVRSVWRKTRLFVPWMVSCSAASQLPLSQTQVPGPSSATGNLWDQLYISVQHCQDLNDKVTSIHHIRDNPVQEGGEGHPGSPAPSGHHLHALLRQPWGGRAVADRVHLFQLLSAVVPGFLCVCLLLLLQWRGTLSCEEEVAPLAGPSLPPSPRGPGHVDPHIAHADQLPQH